MDLEEVLPQYLPFFRFGFVFQVMFKDICSTIVGFTYIGTVEAVLYRGITKFLSVLSICLFQYW